MWLVQMWLRKQQLHFCKKKKSHRLKKLKNKTWFNLFISVFTSRLQEKDTLHQSNKYFWIQLWHHSVASHVTHTGLLWAWWYVWRWLLLPVLTLLVIIVLHPRFVLHARENSVYCLWPGNTGPVPAQGKRERNRPHPEHHATFCYLPEFGEHCPWN